MRAVARRAEHSRPTTAVPRGSVRELGGIAGDEDGLLAEINVTPLVDVMLVLLIIFIITAPMLVQGLNVNLPKQDAPSIASEGAAGFYGGEVAAHIVAEMERGGGLITAARIVPPTSQNQRTIESDLREFVKDRTALPDDKLQWQCEQAVRNYDPCISCATHFLKLEVDRG